MDILGKIHADGNTVVLVTHEDDISHFAHRIIRLKDGIVESDRQNANPLLLHKWLNFFQTNSCKFCCFVQRQDYGI